MKRICGYNIKEISQFRWNRWGETKCKRKTFPCPTQCLLYRNQYPATWNWWRRRGRWGDKVSPVHHPLSYCPNWHLHCGVWTLSKYLKLGHQICPKLAVGDKYSFPNSCSIYCTDYRIDSGNICYHCECIRNCLIN